MELAKENNDAVTLKIARQVGGGHNLDDCQRMHRMLDEYARLGKPKIVKENGIKITKCPPARAHGVWSKNRF